MLKLSEDPFNKNSSAWLSDPETRISICIRQVSSDAATLRRGRWRQRCRCCISAAAAAAAEYRQLDDSESVIIY